MSRTEIKELSLGKRIIKIVRENQQWLGFFIIAIILLYSFITVLYEPRHVLLDILYGILFVFLIVGLYKAFITEKKEKKKIRIDVFDAFAAASGVLATYCLVHFLGFNVVMASSLLGIIGYIFLRKYEVPIYCGSFAGMVSVALFDLSEVLVLSLICSVIYILTKPLFVGYGGKLGTVAFMSSLILHSIFNDQFLVVQSDLHFGFLILATVLGVTVTFYSQHILKISAVMSSAAFSFIIATILFFILPSHIEYSVILFSASFIGMSSKDKLPNIFYVILSGLILGVIYYVFVHYFNGLGGKLGLMALISVMVTTGISEILKKEIHNFAYLPLKNNNQNTDK